MSEDIKKIEAKWQKKNPTLDEWATMSDFEAAVLLCRDIYGNFAYRGYHSNVDKLLAQCKDAVYAVRNYTFSKPKYKIVTKYKHGLTIDAGSAFYISLDLHILVGDRKIKYTSDYDLKGRFDLFPEWTVAPTEYRNAIPQIGRDNIAARTQEFAVIWEDMRAAIPATLQKHLKSGKVEDVAVEKFAIMMERLGDTIDLHFIEMLMKHFKEDSGNSVELFFESCRRNDATINQLDESKIRRAWDLRSVKKIMES